VGRRSTVRTEGKTTRYEITAQLAQQRINSRAKELLDIGLPKAEDSPGVLKALRSTPVANSFIST